MSREQLEKKLKIKRITFCKEYVFDWNASRAARDAGYSKKTAGSMGHELLKIPEIKQYIELIKSDLEELSGVTKLRNLKELAKIAYSSIAHLHDTWVDLVEYENLTEDQKAAIESIETDTVKRFEGIYSEPVEVEKVKIKLHPKGSAIAEINKMMGYHAAEKVNIGGDADNPLTLRIGGKDVKI